MFFKFPISVPISQEPISGSLKVPKKDITSKTTTFVLFTFITPYECYFDDDDDDNDDDDDGGGGGGGVGERKALASIGQNF